MCVLVVEGIRPGRKLVSRVFPAAGINLIDLTTISWEPIQSFVGSEHFVETFWQRTRCNRDPTQLKHFEADEEILPVGPPGSTYLI